MKPIIRFCLAQINPFVGDLKGNSRKLITTAEDAAAKNADVVIFPELSLCGYPPEDLLLQPAFVRQNRTYLDTICASLPGICAVVGFPLKKGTRLYNAAAVIHNRRIRYVYRKIHLPNYGVFDEKRYFSAGREIPLITIHNMLSVGITICQDMWEQNGPHMLQTRDGKADVIINISASPYHRGKIRERYALVTHLARKTKAYYLYCNIVGGQDELVFDGGSFAVDPRGAVIAQGKQFAEDSVFIDIPLGRKKTRNAKKTAAGACRVIKIGCYRPISHIPIIARRESLYSAAEEIYRALVLGLHDYVIKNCFQKAVIGLSGGIDSSLTAAIAVDALGKENVIGISMPSEYSSVQTQQDARRLAVNLGIVFHTIPIDPIREIFRKILLPYFKGLKQDITEENLQARIRGMLLMAFSNKFSWLVLTTGNKSEISVGYCTLYGDTAGGFGVLKDIPKTTVYQLTEYVNQKTGKFLIPGTVISRPPTAELKFNQQDEDSLLSYPELDIILEGYIEKRKDISTIHLPSVPKAEIRRIIALVDRNEYKRRQMPPGIKITPLAFGKDRRIPITFKKT